MTFNSFGNVYISSYNSRNRRRPPVPGREEIYQESQTAEQDDHDYCEYDPHNDWHQQAAAHKEPHLETATLRAPSSGYQTMASDHNDHNDSPQYTRVYTDKQLKEMARENLNNQPLIS